ncbi:MAG: fibronectin type III domain-containing protein, partial [Thermoguttaceae bacterium]|nr:fibronectin type III domain-containing protein [Thermoguttaceae bacterium]
MTKNHKSSLFSNHSSRRSEKRAPRSTSLRIEALENRELLSVNPADYAQLRESFDQLALPENFSDVNVIELPALTAEALQNAINDAATTPQDDLIVVNPTELGENTLSLADATIVVDFDASEFGAITLVSTGDERLQISVNPEDYSFDFRSGVMNFAGLDFVNVADMGLLCTIDAPALDAQLVDSFEQDVRYFDVDGLELIEETSGEDVFDSFENVYAMQDGVELEVQEATWNRAGAWTNNYAIIFIGHYNNAKENAYFKRLATRLYNTLIDDYGLLPKDVHVFYAGGEQFIRGVNVQPATPDNLDNCLAKLNREMNNNSRLLAFIDDHGGGGSSYLGDEAIAAQGYSIGTWHFSSMIRQIKSGYVTCALGFCHSGGVLEVAKDDIIHYYDGNASFSIGASSPYNENSTYATKGTFLDWEWRWRGLKSGIYFIFAGEDLSWSDSFVNALDAGIVSSGSLFANAENNYFARKGEDHPYHWNSQRVFNTTISGSPTTKLSSPAPTIRAVTDKTITVTWEPSYFSGYMVRPSEISYVVQWRRYDSDSWESRTVSAYEYETNNKSFTIRSFDGAPLEGGVTYDVTVY